jgi:hypothetical protein
MRRYKDLWRGSNRCCQGQYRRRNGGVMGCCINGPQVERALTWVKEGVAEACWIAAYTWDKNDDVEA